MKKLWKKLAGNIGGACLFLALICGIAPQQIQGQTNVLQTDSIEDCSDEIRRGILQAGGWLQGDSGSKKTTFRVMESENELEELLLKSMKSHASTLDLRAFRISKDDFSVLYTRLVNSHPELFYIDMDHSSWRYYELTGYMMDINWSYYWKEEECKVKEQEYEAAIQLALKDVNPEWSDLEKALYINEYLCENITYDDSLRYFDAYHGLVDGTTVCQGYALAFKELAERMGLRAQMVTSEALQHAWNMVEVDGKYYHVDTTWNDNVYEGGASSHFYFLKSTKFFMNDSVGTSTGHRATDYVVQGDWDADYAVYTDYDYCSIWNDVHSTFNYVDGYWYTFEDKAGNILQYEYQNGALKYHGKKSLKSYQLLSGAQGCFSSLGDYNGKLYFSYGNIGIYQCDIPTDQVTLVYEFPKEIRKLNGYAVYLNVDSYGRVSYLYFDGDRLRNIDHAFCLDDKTYTISYETYGGTLDSSAPGTYQSLSDTIVLKNPKRSGYIFLGWYTGNDFKTKVTCIPKGSYGNKKLYAGWTKKYTINYKLNGGKNSAENPKSYSKLTDTIVLRQPKRSGYKFKGWYKDKNCTKKVTRIKKGSTGNLTLYAKWTKKK